MRLPSPRTVLPLLIAAALGATLGPVGTASAQETAVDAALLDGLEYRMVGPHRGGRVTAVTGVPGREHTFLQGTTGGGVWKTEDAGETWTNITDGFLEVASVGAVEVAESDPNVIYVGTGSACIRGNVSTGRGVYRSTDGGKTWEFVGLPEAGQIGRIAVHPDDPDRVFVAALGHPFGSNPERGVYRSSDGGDTWEKVLFVSDSTGAVDLAMNPENPREIYAAMWRAERKPWTIIDAAREGGLYKTTDGGDTWTKLEDGLPDGLVGRIGVTVSPADPDRVWALVSAHDPEGGVYRSDDAGKTWTRVNRARKLRQRGWYYSHVHADPQDPNTVYALNTGMYRSVDGGKTFERIRVPHGDVHDLWVSPESPEVMVVGNDGGAQVSVTGGESWSTMHNQPTAEFYRVTVDDQIPYRLYGAQQDNSTISVPSWTAGGLSPEQHWYGVGGCESGHIAVRPDDPNTVYSGCYIGEIERHDVQTGESFKVSVDPVLVDGIAPRDLRYRFNWNHPIRFSPHDPGILYSLSQRVHRTDDGGETWETISPDLTTNDKSTQPFPGGPLQHDHTSVEVYNTIFAFEESPHAAGTLWAGSDDGLVHLSRDDGETWTEVTPEAMPPEGTVNAIEISPHQGGEVYLAVYRYRMDDWAPYVFRTEDYGESWELLTDGTNGIPADHPVRVVREDPNREGLLYAGTEFGMFVSFDDGESWQPFQQNLPVTPVTDLRVHRKDLVVATQGRSFWILDDLTPLHRLTDEIARSEAHLFAPRDARLVRRTSRAGERSPAPAPNGASIYYYFAEAPEEPVTLEIVDDEGAVIRSFSSAEDRSPLEAEAGLHRFVWNLRGAAPELRDDLVIGLGFTGGPKVAPGTFRVRLRSGAGSQVQPIRVQKDPRRTDVTQEDLERRYELMTRIRAALTETHAAVSTIRSVRDQIRSASDRLAGTSHEAGLEKRVAGVTDQLTAIERELTQPKAETGQDLINFPPMLDNQLAYLYGYVDDAYGAPTAASYTRFDELSAELDRHRDRLHEVIDGEIARLNDWLRERGASGITVPSLDAPNATVSRGEAAGSDGGTVAGGE